MPEIYLPEKVSPSSSGQPNMDPGKAGGLGKGLQSVGQGVEQASRGIALYEEAKQNFDDYQTAHVAQRAAKLTEKTNKVLNENLSLQSLTDQEEQWSDEFNQIWTHPEVQANPAEGRTRWRDKREQLLQQAQPPKFEADPYDSGAVRRHTAEWSKGVAELKKKYIGLEAGKYASATDAQTKGLLATVGDKMVNNAVRDIDANGRFDHFEAEAKLQDLQTRLTRSGSFASPEHAKAYVDGVRKRIIEAVYNKQKITDPAGAYMTMAYGSDAPADAWMDQQPRFEAVNYLLKDLPVEEREKLIGKMKGDFADVQLNQIYMDENRNLWKAANVVDRAMTGQISMMGLAKLQSRFPDIITTDVFNKAAGVVAKNIDDIEQTRKREYEQNVQQRKDQQDKTASDLWHELVTPSNVPLTPGRVQQYVNSGWLAKDDAVGLFKYFHENAEGDLNDPNTVTEFVDTKHAIALNPSAVNPTKDILMNDGMNHKQKLAALQYYQTMKDHHDSHGPLSSPEYSKYDSMIVTRTGGVMADYTEDKQGLGVLRTQMQEMLMQMVGSGKYSPTEAYEKVTKFFDPQLTQMTNQAWPHAPVLLDKKFLTKYPPGPDRDGLIMQFQRELTFLQRMQASGNAELFSDAMKERLKQLEQADSSANSNEADAKSTLDAKLKANRTRKGIK